MQGGSLDTSAILRLILGDSPAQYEALIALLEKSQRLVSIADAALIEAGYALQHHYDFTPRMIAEALEEVVEQPKFNCNRILFRQALPMFVNHAKLSLVDCCLAVYADLSDATPLWTFDRKLASQASTAEIIS